MNIESLISKLELGCEVGARALLGWQLVTVIDGVRTSGYIVETEAYSQDDPASHTYKGKTIRNQAMFGPAGTLYVYFTYGMHYCVNIVTGNEGYGEGVLIRALQPKDGIEHMTLRRRGLSESQLTNGPGKLVQALGIQAGVNGSQVGKSIVYLEPGLHVKNNEIMIGPRIGISKATDVFRRYYLKDNNFVSKK